MISQHSSGRLDVATERPASAANPMIAIRSILPSLPPAERRVAEGVLAQPGDIVFLSIGDLAARASTSEATVVRLCQRAGFAGYPELRLALATQVGRSRRHAPMSRIVGTDIGADDALAEIVAKVGAARRRRPSATPSSSSTSGALAAGHARPWPPLVASSSTASAPRASWPSTSSRSSAASGSPLRPRSTGTLP